MTINTGTLSNTRKEHPIEKDRLHKRNRHRTRYDFPSLLATFPSLAPFVTDNRYGDLSVDFGNPAAVKALNTALLMHYYDIIEWDIPAGYLCPPIPGRADYIHYAADILSQKFFGKIPTGKIIKCMDIGVGANCIYPIIGIKEYGWTFIGSDIDPNAITAAAKIVNKNKHLSEMVELRLQPNPENIFKNILTDTEKIDLAICNPPFHASYAEARAGTMRKLKNLGLSVPQKPVLNFGGKNNELWCEGGEERFIQTMISESKWYGSTCFWFTTLISKQSNLKQALKWLMQAGVMESRIVPMGQGNKTSRILAWTFLNPRQQKEWAEGWCL